MKAASASFALLAIFGLTALAQRPDPLEAAKANQRIADQKAEAEVKKALDDAEKLSRAFPDKAVQYLKAAQLSLDTSGGISTETRKSLTASLQTKLAAVTGKPIPNNGVKLDPLGPVVKAKQDANREKYEAEVKAVRQGIEDVKKLQDANQITAANRLVAQLQAKYPNDVAVMMLAQKDNFANSVAMARDLNEQAQQRVNKALFQASEAALPAIRDVEFPAGWKEKMKNRAGVNDVKLTDKEKKILDALEKEINLPGAKDKPLEYLLQEISTAMDIPLLIDKASLQALDIDLTKTGSLDARGISARTALRQLLAGQGLTYVIRSETVQIMTVEKARETLVARAYYLGDVVQGIGPFGGAATWGTFLDFQQTQANVQTVIDMIQDSVDPQSWKKRGGPGTITFHFPSMSIIVRASSEVHAALGSKLGSK